MQGLERFLELARGVCLIAAALWPVTLGFLVAWVVAVAAPSAPPDRRRELALGLPAFAFPVAILACGAAFAALPTGGGDEVRSAVGQTLVVVLLLAQLPLAGLAIWRAGEGWSVAAASWACGGYLSLLAAFIGGMAVTGVWL